MTTYEEFYVSSEMLTQEQSLEVEQFCEEAIECLVNSGALPFTESSFIGEHKEELIWEKAVELWNKSKQQGAEFHSSPFRHR